MKRANESAKKSSTDKTSDEPEQVSNANGEASSENDYGNVVGTESDQDDTTLYKSKALIQFGMKQYSTGSHFAVSGDKADVETESGASELSGMVENAIFDALEKIMQDRLISQCPCCSCCCDVPTIQ